MNLCYLIFEYKLFDDKTKEKYLNFFIAILIDNNYNTKCSHIHYLFLYTPLKLILKGVPDPCRIAAPTVSISFFTMY